MDKCSLKKAFLLHVTCCNNPFTDLQISVWCSKIDFTQNQRRIGFRYCNLATLNTIQILREINLGNSRCSKSALFTIQKTLNCHFWYQPELISHKTEYDRIVIIHFRLLSTAPIIPAGGAFSNNKQFTKLTSLSTHE